MVIVTRARHAPRVLALALALTAVGVGGCAGRWVYEKPSASPAQIDRDMTFCERAAKPTGPLAYPAFSGLDRERFNACMEARGYRVSREPAR